MLAQIGICGGAPAGRILPMRLTAQRSNRFCAKSEFAGEPPLAGFSQCALRRKGRIGSALNWNLRGSPRWQDSPNAPYGAKVE